MGLEGRSLVAAEALSLAELHEHISCGDMVAREVLSANLLPLLRARLRGLCPAARDDAANDAAVDALLHYFSQPDRFDPSRGVPLEGFLHVIARRRLLNALRHSAARTRWESEHAALHSSASPRLESYSLITIQQGVERALVAANLGTCDRIALSRWLDGEDTSAIAKALEVSNLSIEEQRREVKRFKDRIKAYLRRWSQRTEK